MDSDTKISDDPETGQVRDSEETPSSPPQDKIVRLFKSIVLNPEDGKYVDSKFVSFKYYNAFNYSLLTDKHDDITLVLGVTSPNTGEGKTVVAANLAVSLAIAHQRETILVDLNLHRPRLHQIFGTELSPGLLESFSNGTIHITRTQVEHLFVLSAGSLDGRNRLTYEYRPMWDEAQYQNDGGSTIALQYMAAFRDVIYSLEHEFDFVVIDMPAMLTQSFPLLFTNLLNGLLLVVQAGKTKRADLEKVVRQLNERQILGFVFNHVTDDYMVR